MKIFLLVFLAFTIIATMSFAAGQKDTGANSPLKIVLLVKSLGNGFFEAVADGGKEAAAELGNVESIYMGASSSTAEVRLR